MRSRLAQTLLNIRISRGAPFIRAQTPSQYGPGAVETGANGPDGTPECFRRLRIIQFFQFAQNQDLAIMFGQCKQRSMQAIEPLVADHRPESIVIDGVGIVQWRFAIRTFSLQPLQHVIAGYAVKKSLQGSPLAIVLP